MRLFAPFVDCYFSNWNIYCSSSTHSIIAISRREPSTFYSLSMNRSRLSFRSSAAYLFIYITDFWAWNVWPTTQMQSHHAIQCFFWRNSSIRFQNEMFQFQSLFVSITEVQKHQTHALHLKCVCVRVWVARFGRMMAFHLVHINE